MQKFMVVSSIILCLSCLPFLDAQLNPVDAPKTSWSTGGLSDYDAIISTLNSDAVATDTKDWNLLSNIFTSDATASYTAAANLSNGLEAIKEVHIQGTAGFISQHALSNFLLDIRDDGRTANASYYAIATLFTNPQQNSGQYVNLYGYYNGELVKKSGGWRICRLEYRFFGPGWTGNLSILPPDHPMAPPASFEPPM